MAKRLFLDDYLFKGPYEEMARSLTSIIDTESGSKIFSSAIDLYATSAVVGAILNLYINPSTNIGEKTLRIMANQFTLRSTELNFIYKFVMLNANKNSLLPIDMINNAFKYYEESDEYADNIKIFEGYMLGGLKEIYESFISPSNKRFSDYQAALNSFVSKFIKSSDDENDTDDIDFDITIAA